jgi:hypothetical protein
MALGPWTHSKQASTSTSSISSSAASPLPALFSPRQRGSMDSTRTSPDLDAMPSKFAAKSQPISELADCASSLISFFWLSQAPGAVPRRGSALPRFANFMQHVLNTSTSSLTSYVRKPHSLIKSTSVICYRDAGIVVHRSLEKIGFHSRRTWQRIFHLRHGPHASQQAI